MNPFWILGVLKATPDGSQDELERVSETGRWREREKDVTFQSYSQRWILELDSRVRKVRRGRIGRCMMILRVGIDGERC